MAPATETTPTEPLANSKADIAGEEVSYSADGITFKGYVAWDKRKQGKRPGVLVVHEWWGHNEYARRRARMLAEMGYTALAVDMFGEGKTADHPKDAGAFASQVMSNKKSAVARFKAAMELLKARATTDPSRIAAIGYCFGGGVVLLMAREGLDLKAVASFHGSLGTESPAKPGAIKGKILVLTGDADPMSPAAVVDAFKQEMDKAGANYEVVSYPGAKHAFTNPAATELGKKFDLPLAYDAAADADSWQRLEKLLASVFGTAPATAK